MAKPFKLDAAPPTLGITRGDGGRFVRDNVVRENATPANPIDEEEEEGKQPEAWAPSIGQGSAQIRGQQNPWPPAGRAVPTAPDGKPYKFGE